jgi:transposase
VSSLVHRAFTHLGMDVSKDSISVAILPAYRDRAEVEKIFHDEQSVRRLSSRFRNPARLWACYEAGPTGYELHRLLVSLGVRCEVVAPSLVPKGKGDKVKTDKRDARRLAGLHRAGQLTAIAVLTPEQEAVRDLCRIRGDMVADLTRARNRLTQFLLPHGVVWRGGSKLDVPPRALAALRALRAPRPRRHPSATTGRQCSCGTPPSKRSRPTWRRGASGSRSATRSPRSPPTGA